VNGNWNSTLASRAEGAVATMGDLDCSNHNCEGVHVEACNNLKERYWRK
jgi:hypothetical protein